jgi:DNA-binding Lrp family transcriptional regulator
MDETDLNILIKLLENSRVTYRELAKTTNMSVSAVHYRINNLVDDEIIGAFIARPSPIALKYLIISIFGSSNAKSLDSVSKELGQHENIFTIAIASGKFLYITGFLRDITSLRDYSTYVSKIAKISEPTIGIMNLPYITTPEPLTTIDYKILKTLNRDARKPITEVADDVGISAKTVRKRLDRMIENNLVDFSIEWSMKAKNNLLTSFHLYLKEDTNIDSTVQYLYEKYSQNVNYCTVYSNIPNFIIMTTWTKTAQESQRIQEKLQTEGFKDVIPNIFLTAMYYDSWVDQLLRIK